ERALVFDEDGAGPKVDICARANGLIEKQLPARYDVDITKVVCLTGIDRAFRRMAGIARIAHYEVGLHLPGAYISLSLERPVLNALDGRGLYGPGLGAR